MTQRERTLLIAVAGVLVLFGLYFGMTRVRSGIASKNAKIERLKKEIEQKDDELFAGMQASEQLVKLTSRSLPSDHQAATTDYREWLEDTVKKCGIDKHSIALQGNGFEGEGKGVYHVMKFIVSGEGDLRHLSKLLYRFYEKDYLHRISSLAIVPMQNGKTPYDLKITVGIDAIALNMAAPDQPPPATISNRVSRTLAQYEEALVNRNLFSLANHAPEIKPEEKTEVAKDSSLEFDVKATEPDGDQSMEYSLVGDIPDGMKIDGKTGKLSWRPKELGSYEALVSVRDSGLPSRSSEQKIKIKVVEPPPTVVKKDPPKFDIASQAEITALLADSKQPQVWVKSKVEAKVHYLKIGDELKLGSVVGTVIAIGATYAEFETDGKRWTVGQGETLADAYKRTMDL